MTLSHQEFTDDHTPIAFFITFRTYGTWLHGDERGSVDRVHNRYGTPRLPANKLRQQYELKLLKQPPVWLTATQREVVTEAIKKACKERNWGLWAINARPNHVHIVVTADCNSKQTRATLKAKATKAMRENGCWTSDLSPWARRGSRQNLWTYQDLIVAIEYVLYEQGED